METEQQRNENQIYIRIFILAKSLSQTLVALQVRNRKQKVASFSLRALFEFFADFLYPLEALTAQFSGICWYH